MGNRNKNEEFALKLEMIADRLKEGCFHFGCQIKNPVGMALQGTCKCSPIEIADDLKRLVISIEVLGRRWE